MPLQERQGFIKDEKKNMTIREKNGQLSASLAAGVYASRKIVKIDRIEIGGSGWRITYRKGR